MQIVQYLDPQSPGDFAARVDEVKTLIDQLGDQGVSSKLHLPGLAQNPGSWQALSDLADWNRLRADSTALIHVHGAESLTSLKGLLGQLRGIPRILSLERNFETPSYKPVARDSWRAKLRSALGPQHILCETKEDQKRAESLFPTTRVDYLPDGIDCTQELPRGDGLAFRHHHGIAQQNPMILIVGSVGAGPEPSLVQKAIGDMLKLHPLGILAFLNVGDRDALRQTLTQSHPRQHRIRVLPHQEQEGLRSAISAADVVVVTPDCPRTDEVITEAWSCLRPVIAPRLGESRLLLRNGKDGLHYKPSSPRQLMDCLKIVFSNPEKTSALTRFGLARILREFDQKMLTRKLCTMYAEIIEDFESTSGKWHWR